jgi:hypothetical protein
LARVLTSSSVIAPHVVLSLHALLALQAPASAAPASTADQTIVWFRSPDAAAVDGRALLDAVAVYTRDLGLTVRTAAATRPVPADAISAGDAVAALRAQGARLGFWCEMRPGADVAMLTVVAADGHLELHLVERTGAHEAEQYRAIALKLRSVLVGTAAPEPAIVVAPPPAPPAPPAPSAPAPAGPDLSLRARPPAPPPWMHLFMTIGYRRRRWTRPPRATRWRSTWRWRWDRPSRSKPAPRCHRRSSAQRRQPSAAASASASTRCRCSTGRS